MCFVLYVASRVTPPLVSWNDENRGVWTEAIDEHHAVVRQRFTLPEAAYVGSDIYCGCGFRHQRVQITDEDDGRQKNHQQLVDYLKQHFSSEEWMELYGCWDRAESQKLEKIE